MNLECWRKHNFLARFEKFRVQNFKLNIPFRIIFGNVISICDCLNTQINHFENGDLLLTLVYSVPSHQLNIGENKAFCLAESLPFNLTTS